MFIKVVEDTKCCHLKRDLFFIGFEC